MEEKSKENNHEKDKCEETQNEDQEKDWFEEK